jgi:hypothetical protein
MSLASFGREAIFGFLTVLFSVKSGRHVMLGGSRCLSRKAAKAVQNIRKLVTGAAEA